MVFDLGLVEKATSYYHLFSVPVMLIVCFLRTASYDNNANDSPKLVPYCLDTQFENGPFQRWYGAATRLNHRSLYMDIKIHEATIL